MTSAETAGELNAAGLDLLFREARTYSGWLPRAVPEELLRRAYDLAKLAPTSANSNPARFVFVVSSEAKTRLRPHLSAGNVEKAMSAPVVVIAAHDTAWFDEMPRLFPGRDVRSVFSEKPQLAQETAFRNGTLQGAYLLVAFRALGLSVGPMSGFDAPGLDREFFPDGRLKSNFLMNVGYGDSKSLWPRNPRLPFEDACQMV